MRNLKTNQTLPHKAWNFTQRALWVRTHRGFFTRIARSVEPPVTPVHVRQVFWDKSQSARIDREIASAILAEPAGKFWGQHAARELGGRAA